MPVAAIASALLIKNTPEEAGAYPDNDKSLSRAELEANLSAIKNHKSEWTLMRLLKDKTTWLVGLALGFCWMSVVGVAGYFIPRLISLGYERSFAVGLLSIHGLIGFVGSYIWGYIDQKSERARHVSCMRRITSLSFYACCL